jgi:hypothetical protein
MIILLFVAGLLALRMFYLIAEVYYERDWPRSTFKGFVTALGLLVVCIIAFN